MRIKEISTANHYSQEKKQCEQDGFNQVVRFHNKLFSGSGNPYDFHGRKLR